MKPLIEMEKKRFQVFSFMGVQKYLLVTEPNFLRLEFLLTLQYVRIRRDLPWNLAEDGFIAHVLLSWRRHRKCDQALKIEQDSWAELLNKSF